MNKMPYKLSSDYEKLQELLYNKFEIVCFFDGKVCIGRRQRRRYIFSIDNLCYFDFSIDCSNRTFAEAIAEYKVKFILPSDIANIFDIYFKVKIHNRRELKKIVGHLTEAGFHEIENPFGVSIKAFGIMVGRANFSIVNYEDIFSEIYRPEVSVNEVLKMKFK